MELVPLSHLPYYDALDDSASTRNPATARNNIMTSNYNRFRLALFVVGFVAACIVLGISINLANYFLPTGLHDFLIFSIVASAFTIIVLIILAQRSQPWIDAIALLILAVLWVAMGAYSQDIIGHQLCYSMRGQTMPAKNNTTFSAESYCRQMKTILAFSWTNFAFLTVGLIFLFQRVSEMQEKYGPDAWRESSSEVSFNVPTDAPSMAVRPQTYTLPQTYPVISPSRRSGSGRSISGRSASGRSASGRSASGQAHTYYSGQHGSPHPQYVQQQPGHSVIIRNGQVTQVPGSVVSA